jgi:hypothetical protein
LRELAREPLLLYLLAAMHRDGELRLEMFEGVEGARAKILIYEKTLDWVLTKQRPDWLNRQLTAMETEGLRRILAEAALCVVQSGGECAAMEMVKERIKDNDSAARLIEQAQERLGDDALKNALAAFYLQPAKGDKGGSVEFAHKSFSEFLFAQRLKESLEEWTAPGRRGEEFIVKNAQMAWEIYDLLGYGGLTPEIVEYLMGLLTASNEFRPVQLFKRLENFYSQWWDGEFIDAPPETLPQKKMRQLKDKKIQTGVRQVDIYTGLNAMILLLELHRYAQLKDDLKDKIIFYPSGEPSTEYALSYGGRLSISINYSNSITPFNLSYIIMPFLYSANFNRAYLVRLDFMGVNLSNTNFTSALLSHTNFTSANLSDANLRNANLSCTSFYQANLSKADLSKANLSKADLSKADLSKADLSKADLKNIFWNEDTKWENVRGLETAQNVPEALKQQLGLG